MIGAIKKVQLFRCKRCPQEIRVLRAYLRQRETLVGAAAQEIQHMQKALTEMNVHFRSQ